MDQVTCFQVQAEEFMSDPNQPKNQGKKKVFSFEVGSAGSDRNLLSSVLHCVVQRLVEAGRLVVCSHAEFCSFLAAQKKRSVPQGKSLNQRTKLLKCVWTIKLPRRKFGLSLVLATHTDFTLINWCLWSPQLQLAAAIRLELSGVSPPRHSVRCMRGA